MLNTVVLSFKTNVNQISCIREELYYQTKANMIEINIVYYHLCVIFFEESLHHMCNPRFLIVVVSQIFPKMGTNADFHELCAQAFINIICTTFHISIYTTYTGKRI